MINDNSNPLPNLLRYYRIKLGLTQQEIANKLNISRSGYANYEEGRCLPSIDQTIALSELLRHDLLFAYTISSQYQKHATKHSQTTFHENSTYLPDITNNLKSTELMQLFEEMLPKEQELIRRYMLKKKEEP
ncbi:MAG: helix-turn-helix transcriptional regulator [Coprococcus sp.]